MHTSDESGNEELYGPIDYSNLGLPVEPEGYMGFQPSFDGKAHILALTSIVCFVKFKNKKLSVDYSR